MCKIEAGLCKALKMDLDLGEDVLENAVADFIWSRSLIGTELMDCLWYLGYRDLLLKWYTFWVASIVYVFQICWRGEWEKCFLDCLGFPILRCMTF